MKLHYYKTAGGKNLILDYINGLSRDEKKDGVAVFKRAKEVSNSFYKNFKGEE